MRASCNWGIRVSNVWNEVSDVHVSCADVAVRVLLFTVVQIFIVFGMADENFTFWDIKKAIASRLAKDIY